MDRLGHADTRTPVSTHTSSRRPSSRTDQTPPTPRFAGYTSKWIVFSIRRGRSDVSARALASNPAPETYARFALSLFLQRRGEIRNHRKGVADVISSVATAIMTIISNSSYEGKGRNQLGGDVLPAIDVVGIAQLMHFTAGLTAGIRSNTEPADDTNEPWCPCLHLCRECDRDRS